MSDGPKIKAIDDDQITCPECGHTDDLNGFDNLGPDDGATLSCPACSARFPIEPATEKP